MKDIALLGLSLWLLADAIDATRKQPTLASTADRSTLRFTAAH
jgi:hypothetical protein